MWTKQHRVFGIFCEISSTHTLTVWHHTHTLVRLVEITIIIQTGKLCRCCFFRWCCCFAPFICLVRSFIFTRCWVFVDVADAVLLVRECGAEKWKVNLIFRHWYTPHTCHPLPRHNSRFLAFIFYFIFYAENFIQNRIWIGMCQCIRYNHVHSRSAVKHP